MNIKGTLIPVGGNEDKGNSESEMYTLEYINDGILSRIVRESGGPDSIIIVIPTASSIPVEVSEMYKGAFAKLGCTQIHIMDIRDRKDAGNPDFISLMEKANCVMFSGGDQSKIVRFISGTKLDSIIKHKYINENFVIAGTSAGAMCMSENMIRGGGRQEVFTKGAVTMGGGMSFIPDLIIDSHFIKRRRMGRLAEAVVAFPSRIGIGLAEDTGLVIKNGNDCEVIGSGMVIIFDPANLTYNDEAFVSEGAPMTITNLKTHILARGNRFQLSNGNLTFSYSKPETEDVKVKLTKSRFL